MIGNNPKAAPSVAAATVVPNGMPQTAIAITIPTASDTRPATWALSLSPPSRTNSVASGIIATSALAAREPPTGSSTCLYTAHSSLRYHWRGGTTRHARVARSGTRRPGPGAAARALDQRVDRRHLAAIQPIPQARDPVL